MLIFSIGSPVESLVLKQRGIIVQFRADEFSFRADEFSPRYTHGNIPIPDYLVRFPNGVTSLHRSTEIAAVDGSQYYKIDNFDSSKSAHNDII